VIYVMRPMEFSAFPTVLLFITLMRLALNVASTRVVLMYGHEGPHAAGRVIEAFGEFVIGGHYMVGFIVFAILTIINFMVVTKGATVTRGQALGTVGQTGSVDSPQLHFEVRRGTEALNPEPYLSRAGS
jgi:hypothetical protein